MQLKAKKLHIQTDANLISSENVNIDYKDSGYYFPEAASKEYSQPTSTTKSFPNKSNLQRKQTNKMAAVKLEPEVATKMKHNRDRKDRNNFRPTGLTVIPRTGSYSEKLNPCLNAGLANGPTNNKNALSAPQLAEHTNWRFPELFGYNFCSSKPDAINPYRSSSIHSNSSEVSCYDRTAEAGLMNDGAHAANPSVYFQTGSALSIANIPNAEQLLLGETGPAAEKLKQMAAQYQLKESAKYKNGGGTIDNYDSGYNCGPTNNHDGVSLYNSASAYALTNEFYCGTVPYSMPLDQASMASPNAYQKSSHTFAHSTNGFGGTRPLSHLPFLSYPVLDQEQVEVVDSSGPTNQNGLSYAASSHGHGQQPIKYGETVLPDSSSNHACSSAYRDTSVPSNQMLSTTVAAMKHGRSDSQTPPPRENNGASCFANTTSKTTAHYFPDKLAKEQLNNRQTGSTNSALNPSGSATSPGATDSAMIWPRSAESTTSAVRTLRY